MHNHLKNRGLLVVSSIALAIAMPVTASAEHHGAPAKEAPAKDSAATKTVTPWGHQSADVKADSAVRYGVLENGMKYAIRHNETPKNSAVVRMHIAVGSIAEAENERGLAHLLEHLAFNGSTNVPEGEMVKILERKGLSFGADTNASTGFDATTYKLDLPQANDDLIDTAMFLMRETASELTITDEAVERERGVVLSEKQTRNSPGLRRLENVLQFVLPDAPFGNRLPIGTEEILKTAPASRITNFYRRYYRPENTTMVIVGDYDIDTVEAKIKAKFADWKGFGPAGVAMDRGKIDITRSFSVGTFSDPALATEVEWATFRPFVRKEDSIAERKRSLLRSLSTRIMGIRIQKLTLAKDAKIRGGGISIGSILDVAEQSALSVNGIEGDWQGALAVGEQQLRKALQYGFTQAELDEQLANLETGYKNAVKQADTRRNRGLAGAILRTIYSKKIVTTPQTRLDIFNTIKPELTVDAVNAAFREAFAAQPSTLHITTKEPIENARAKAAVTLANSAKMAVTPPEKVEDKAFAYDSFGAPGKVSQDARIEDLGIRTVLFENGVRLNIKKTDFEEDRIRYRLRFGSGGLAVGQGKPGLNYYLGSMSAVMGLKEHSFEELQRIMAGKAVSFGIGYGSDAFTKSGSTTPDDAELQMKLLAAFMTAPGYREEADTVWQNQVKALLPQLDAQPQSVAQLAVPRILTSGDTRFGIGAPNELTDRNREEVKALLEAQSKDTPVEIGIVGDIDERAAIDMIAKTFGALPQRKTASPDYAEARMVKFTDKRGMMTLYHKGKDDQGMVLAYWPTTDGKDFKSSVIRSLASEVFGLLLLDEVREKLGATYSPGTGSSASRLYDGYGHLNTRIVAEPAKMDIISKAIRDITKQMRDAPVADDVLLRARKPLLEKIEKQPRENGSWMGIVDEAQTDTENLNRWRTRMDVYKSVTTKDIQAVAKAYLTDETQLEIRIFSEKFKNQVASSTTD